MSLKFDADVYTRGEVDEMLRTHNFTLEGLLDHFGLRTTYKAVILGAELRAIFEAAAALLSATVREAAKSSQVQPARSSTGAVARNLKGVRSKAQNRHETAPFTPAERDELLKPRSTTSKQQVRILSTKGGE